MKVGYSFLYIDIFIIYKRESQMIQKKVRDTQAILIKLFKTHYNTVDATN